MKSLQLVIVKIRSIGLGLNNAFMIYVDCLRKVCDFEVRHMIQGKFYEGTKAEYTTVSLTSMQHSQG